MASGDGWPGMTGVHGNGETSRKRRKATEGEATLCLLKGAELDLIPLWVQVGVYFFFGKDCGQIAMALLIKVTADFPEWW